MVEASCPNPSNLKAQEEEDNCKLDLALVFDTTSSMGDEIDEVKNSATEIVTKLFAKFPDSRVSIVDYQDRYPRGYPEDYPYNAVLPFSDTITSITDAINNLSLGDGGDYPETAYTALINTLQANQLGGWREDAEKAIILFTDAPPHDPEPITGYTLEDVINASQNPATIDINLASLSLTNTTNKPVSIYTVLLENDEDALTIFSELSGQTGGKVYQSTDIVASFLDAITDIEEKIANSPNQTVPEPSNLFGLFIIVLGSILKLKHSSQD